MTKTLQIRMFGTHSEKQSSIYYEKQRQVNLEFWKMSQKSMII